MIIRERMKGVSDSSYICVVASMYVATDTENMHVASLYIRRNFDWYVTMGVVLGPQFSSLALSHLTFWLLIRKMSAQNH